MFKNSVDSIMKTFNKTIFDLERLEERKHTEIEDIDGIISVAEDQRSKAVSEINRAEKIRKNLVKIME